MLQPSKEGNNLKAAFKEGVNFEEKILERNACGQKHEEYEDYSSRYDFTFLTPCSHEMRFKVWTKLIPNSVSCTMPLKLRLKILHLVGIFFL